MIATIRSTLLDRALVRGNHSIVKNRKQRNRSPCLLISRVIKKKIPAVPCKSFRSDAWEIQFDKLGHDLRDKCNQHRGAGAFVQFNLSQQIFFYAREIHFSVCRSSVRFVRNRGKQTNE